VIRVDRLGEPHILQEKKATWTADFVANTKARPDTSKYRHREIVDTLRSMSHDKCFYCEVREGRLTVDHHIEVGERRDLAFEWTNLYLACDKCQSKGPNRSIPVADCVDPCDAAITPEDHVSFVDERAKHRSARGEKTIKKYRLNHPERLLQRRGQLVLFMHVLDRIRQAQIADDGRAMTSGELDELRRFSDPAEPFSLMFSHLLRSKSLL
jgi:hypothetical protein